MATAKKKPGQSRPASQKSALNDRTDNLRQSTDVYGRKKPNKGRGAPRSPR